MSKRQIVMLLAVAIIAIALLSGLPSSWNTALYLILAFLIILTAYLMKPAQAAARPAAPYAEHVPEQPAPLTDKDAPPLS